MKLERTQAWAGIGVPAEDLRETPAQQPSELATCLPLVRFKVRERFFTWQQRPGELDGGLLAA